MSDSRDPSSVRDEPSQEKAGPTAVEKPASTPDYAAMLSSLTREGLQELHEKAVASDRYLDHLRRKSAEFENLVKRNERDRSDWAKYSGQKVLAAVLPLMDSVLQSADALTRVLAQFEKTLTDLGVQPIEAAGKRFDPALHEAILQEESDDVEDLTVLAELVKGYRLHDRILRPARVKVSRKPVPPGPASSGESAGKGGEEGPKAEE